MSRAHPDPPPKPETPESMADKVDAIHRRIVQERGIELGGLLDILGNRRKLMWLNFSAGVARGVGFFLGVTMIGALLLAGVAFAFNAAVGYMGFKDLTLEDAVKAAVRKFSEIEKIATEAQEEVKTEEVHRQEMDRLAPIDPDPLAPEPQPDPPR